MQFEFNDTLTLSKPRRTRDGYLVADVQAARTGIQQYAGADVGLVDREVVNVYRPPEEVFAQDSMASFAHKPITDDHPPEMVNSKNWITYARGKTGGEVARNGQFIAVPMSVMDEATAVKIEDQDKRELSAGYTCDLDFTPGTTPTGEAYDVVQRNIRINHIAVVDRGRAGRNCRIGDAKQGTEKMTLQTITFDGLPFEVNDQGARIIAKVEGQLADARAELDTVKTGHATEIADKDKQLAAKDSEIDKLKAAQVDDAALDALVEERATVVATAKKIADTVDTKGKSIAEIRRAVVAAELGDDRVKDKSDDYVTATFDGLVDAAPDAVRSALMGDGNSPRTPVNTNDADKAYGEMTAGLQDAWKGDK